MDGPKAAGVILKAADTGRILMLQRGLDPTDPAAGKWEAPGGHIEEGEHPHQAALREFAEEVGHPVPPDARLVDQWDSSNGIYRSHLMVVPSEDHIDINLPHADRYVANPDDPDGDIVETAAWWDPADLRSNPAVRQEMRGTRWSRIEQAEAKAWPVATADSLHYRRAFNPVEICPNCRYDEDSYCVILNRQVAADTVCDDWTAQAGKAWTVGGRKDWTTQERDDHGRFGSGGGGTATAVRDAVDPASLADTIARGATVTVPAARLGGVLHAWAESPRPVNMARLHVTGIGASHLFTEHAKELPREAMPVVPANPAGLVGFSRALADAGVSAHFAEVDPRSLVATQNELDGRKVGSMLGRLEANGGRFPDSPVVPALVVSKDGEVLDGHHRWAACAAYAVGHPGYRVPVLRCDTDIDRLLDIGWRFDAAHGIDVNRFGAKVRFGDVPDGPPPDGDRPWLWFDGRWILVSTDTDAGVPRKLDFPAGSTEAKAFDQDQPRDDDGRFAEFASHPATMWHGTPDARTWATGAAYGIHVGSREAAKQALEARIGKRADGKDWDGTQEYGKTLLVAARGGTGYNARGPAEAAYPTGRATYSGGQPIPMDAHPSLFPVRIVGPMTNSRSTPHDDFRANGMMRAQLARGRAKSGYYYTNVGEDEGSVSAVVPSRDHLQTYEDYTAHSTKAKGGPHHSASQYRHPGGVFGKEPKPPKAPFKDPTKDPGDLRPGGAPQIRGGVRVTHTAFVAQHPEVAAWVRQGDTIHRFPDTDGHVEVSHLDSTWTEFRPKPDGKLHVTRRYEPPPPDPEEGATVSAAIKPKVKVYWNPEVKADRRIGNFAGKLSEALDAHPMPEGVETHVDTYSKDPSVWVTHPYEPGSASRSAAEVRTDATNPDHLDPRFVLGQARDSFARQSRDSRYTEEARSAAGRAAATLDHHLGGGGGDQPRDDHGRFASKARQAKGDTDAPYYVRELAKPDKDGNRFVVVNHAGVVKASFAAHPAALAYQRALMVNVPGAAAAADRAHDRTPKAVTRRGSNPSKKRLPWVEVKYSDDEARDDHGRWAGSGGGVGRQMVALLDRVVNREHGAPHPGIAGLVDRHDAGIDHPGPLVGAGSAMASAGLHTGGPSGVHITAREAEGPEGVGPQAYASRTVYAADRDGPAQPAGYEPSTKYGMRLDGGPMTDPRVWMLKGDQADKEIWSRVPTTMIDPKGLVATEPFVKTASIDKVVSGGEPFREGYDPKILINQAGQRVVIDGHHRVAMHNALGHDRMRAKVIDVRGLPGKDRDDIDAKAAVAAAMWVRHVDTKGSTTWLEVKYNPYHDEHGLFASGDSSGGDRSHPAGETSKPAPGAEQFGADHPQLPTAEFDRRVDGVYQSMRAADYQANFGRAVAMSEGLQAAAEAAGGAATSDDSRLAERVIAGATANEPHITADLVRLLHSPTWVDEHGIVRGNATAVPRLEGLEFRLKKADSMARKFSTDDGFKGLTSNEKSAKINDAVRYTALFKPEEYTKQTKELVDKLKGEGYKLEKLKNTWDPSNPYRGVNSVWSDPNRQKFELQFHTPASMAVKDDIHKIYDGARLLPDTSADPRKVFMSATTRTVSDRLGASPPEAEQLPTCGTETTPACGDIY